MNKVPKIEIKNLQKSYTNKKKNYCVPLSKCDLKVNTNEFFVILGESGSGKSTLLRVICGLEPYDFGDVLLDGIDSRTISQTNKNMSFVSQNIVLFPHKTVYENLIVSLTLNRFAKEDKINRINELSNIFHLEMLLTRKPRELSGGQQQRVAVARAMAKKPDICLFDEPLASLDPIFHEDLINMFKEVQKETLTTFLYSTHNQIEAFKLADKIGILHNRKFEQIGTVNEIINHPVSEYVASYLKSVFMFILPVKYSEGFIRDDKYGLNISIKTKTNILNKYKGKKLKLAVKSSDIVFEHGSATLDVINVTPSAITIVVNEEEIVIPYVNNLSPDIKKINFDIKVIEPILFYEGKNIF